MFASVQALLSNIVDYAGTFPPARLPLDQAFRNYARYRREPEAWLLGKFICPADKLAELTPLLRELGDAGRPFAFSILGRGGADAKEFFRNIQTDLADVRGFLDACPGRAAAHAYETRLPATLFDPIKSHQLGAAVATLGFLIDTSGLALTPFVEAPLPTRENLHAVIQTLYDDRQSPEAARRMNCPAAGFKLRTGGLEAAAFPAPDLVAAVICACAKATVAFKATAGLHHPLRHFSSAVQTKMHGFVNVFAAGCLCAAHDLSPTIVQQLLEDETAANFQMSENVLAWKHLRVSTDQITPSRRDSFLSFGSCSFDEPRDDLRALGWI